MTTEVKVPELGESVVEATIASWLVNVGDAVNAGDMIVELETDKVSLEVEAPVAGVIASLSAAEGDDVSIGDVIAVINAGEGVAAAAPAPAAAKAARRAPRRSAPAALEGARWPLGRRG